MSRFIWGARLVVGLLVAAVFALVVALSYLRHDYPAAAFMGSMGIMGFVTPWLVAWTHKRLGRW